MPVRRFRSVEELEDDRWKWREPDSPALWRSIRATWGLARRTAHRRFPAGVHKHRSIEALNRQTEEWERADAPGEAR